MFLTFFFPSSRLRCIVNMAFYCTGCRLCACLCSQCLTLHFSLLNVNYIAMPLFCVCFTMHATPARSCLLTLHSKCQHCSQVCRELFSKFPQARCGQVSGLHSIWRVLSCRDNGREMNSAVPLTGPKENGYSASVITAKQCISALLD